jgi:hypothetical protein
MAENKSYQYNPIQHEDGIRLVQIHPGNNDDDIYISVEPHRLSQSPEYEALSYTWGNRNNPLNLWKISLSDKEIVRYVTRFRKWVTVFLKMRARRTEVLPEWNSYSSCLQYQKRIEYLN